MNSGSIRLKRHFNASAERVFDAWLDSQHVGRWLFTNPKGQIVHVQIDARVGGSFSITRRDGEDIEHVGKYLEIQRPRRLVFEFSVPRFSTQITVVSIVIEPAGDGCDLTLTHTGVLPEWIDKTTEGWGRILASLAGEIDPNASFGIVIEPGAIRFQRILPGPIERVWRYLTDGDKRAWWFAGGKTEPRVGGLFELKFDFPSLSADRSPPPEKFKNLVGEHAPHYQQRITRHEPPNVLSWTWDGGIDGPSEVTFELSPREEKVLLVLTHRRIADKHVPGIAAGWHTHLSLLIDRMEGRVPAVIWPLVEEMDREYEYRLGGI
jgi:uncharacterized protein YndB with AHSA1/START domain